MLALIAGLFVPAAGVWLTTHRTAWGVIVAMFLINGLPVFLIITLSYMAFASGRTTLMNSTAGTIALLVASLLTLHFILMLAAIGTGALLGYKTPERKAIAFISSQKTLPTAIGILVSLGLAGGAAALPCVIYHFGQVLCDSVIAALWRSWTDRANASWSGKKLTPSQ